MHQFNWKEENYNHINSTHPYNHSLPQLTFISQKPIHLTYMDEVFNELSFMKDLYSVCRPSFIHSI